SCSLHTGDPCAGGPECADACDEALDTCNDPSGTTCSTDGNVCTIDECDGSGTCGHQPGNAGTTCRADAGGCDVPEVCDGTNAACPADAVEPDGTSCNDGNACTIADECTTGVCAGNSMTFGDGTLQGGCSEECDDGNLVADD